MFDNYVLSDGSVRNERNGKGEVCGFSMKSWKAHRHGGNLTKTRRRSSHGASVLK